MTTEIGQALTANRLGDGTAVFLTRAGTWSEAIDDAAVALETVAAEALAARGATAEAENLVTGAYLIAVERVNGRVRAQHIRERIRSLGPTIHSDHGKQAEAKGGGFDAVGRAA